MFDPLDLYTADEVKIETEPTSSPKNGSPLDSVDRESIICEFEENIENSGFLDVMDLPQVHFAPPQAVLCVLYLLQPANQVNFSGVDTKQDVTVTSICEEKHVPVEYLDKTVTYYTKQWPNSHLDSAAKICSKVPQMVATHGASMLQYYTSVLKHYERKDLPLQDEIIRQVSLRIAESCGRTAQPSMSRKFTFDLLERSIEIHEPSLTADNLGWKTWGSSFILSQKLIKRLQKTQYSTKLRVLELGSGTGLAGISWISKWIEIYENNGTEMFLTDLPVIVPNLRKNVDINGLSNVAKVAALDWTDPSDFIVAHTDKVFHILIVSDPIYSPNHPELVVNMIERFLSDQGVCFLEIPVRPKYAKERQRLRQLLADKSFGIINEEIDQGLEDWGMVDYVYLEIKRKNVVNIGMQ